MFWQDDPQVHLARLMCGHGYLSHYHQDLKAAHNWIEGRYPPDMENREQELHKAIRALYRKHGGEDNV